MTISLQDTTFTYEGDVVALRNLNLAAHKGEFVVVLGANGAGKSTLCYLLSGIVPHIYGGRRRGYVSVAGLDPWDEPLYVTSQRCGVLMQDPEVQLFMPTLKAELAFGPANLGVPRDEIIQRSQAALALVRLEGLEEHNPRDLSGGQKQRAALAAVLTMNPQVLVLDEPTSQLDPLGRWEVVEAIERLKQKGNLTIVMTTHETEEVLRLADQVLVLERGETMLQGTPTEVFTQAERLEEAGVKTPALILVQSRLLRPGERKAPPPDAGRVNLTLSEVAHQTWEAVEVGRLAVQSKDLPRPRAVAPDAPVILEARNLIVEYPGPPPVVALRDVNIQIHQGEFVGIVGQNGSGKSTLAKGIANGFPLGATAARKEIMSQWGAASHGTTYGGSPISCAAALATINVIREENLLENARAQGGYILETLRELQTELPIVGDVRGMGLMIAVEFVRPGTDKEPNPEAVRRILQRALEGGLLLYPCGHWTQTIRFIPPLTITREQVDEGLAIFRQAVLAESA